jgi:Spy/CpxP family protein refolding chaperone
MMNQLTSAARLPSPAVRLRLAVAAAALALGAGVATTASAHAGEGAGRHAMAGMHAMHAGHGGPGMMGPRMGERALDAVGASAEQKAQIRQIMEAARTELQPQREAGRALREQMRALFAQPSVDADAVEALRRQIAAQHDAASRRMTQAMVEASRVLTPDQRQALAQQMQERRERMQQRRGEHRHERGLPGAGRS